MLRRRELFALLRPRQRPHGRRRGAAACAAGPRVRQRIERDGGRVLAIGPAEQRKFLEDEVERWSALVARYGVSIE